MKEKGTITESCGNVAAGGLDRHSYFYEKLIIETPEGLLRRTYCDDCCVYWDTPYKKIEVKDVGNES